MDRLHFHRIIAYSSKLLHSTLIPNQMKDLLTKTLLEGAKKGGLGIYETTQLQAKGRNLELGDHHPYINLNPVTIFPKRDGHPQLQALISVPVEKPL